MGIGFFNKFVPNYMLECPKISRRLYLKEATVMTGVYEKNVSKV